MYHHHHHRHHHPFCHFGHFGACIVYACMCACTYSASRRSASIPRLASPRVMRAFLQKASGEARDPSSVAQHADTFSSIAAVNRWLSVQGAACNTPDFRKLRAAVSVLTKTPNPRREEVSPLCSSWNVRQYVQKHRRPLATLIK